MTAVSTRPRLHCSDCGIEQIHGRGLCRACYGRRKRRGSLPPDPTVKDRLLANVHFDQSGCWLWTGHLLSTGYSQMRVAGKSIGIHRLAYEAFVAPIPDGLQIDHLCRVRHCINPEHLEAVTARVNVLRGLNGFAGINEAKTLCINGHPFVAENTYVDRRGKRHCKTCRRDRRHRYVSTPQGRAAKATRERRRYARNRNGETS